jgi:hypothetical protein
MVKEIKLTQGKIALVDDEDFKNINSYRWAAHKHSLTFYAVRHPKGSREKLTRMHNDVLGHKSGFEIDHIDGDGLNNQRSNLRFVTRRQNLQNLHIKKSSIYPGVSWSKKRKLWTSQIWINGKAKRLGAFTNETEAFSAYCNALKEINQILLDNEGNT